MDVDHAGEPILTIGARDASVTIGTLTGLVIISDIGGITATGILTGTTGDIAIETWTAIEPGVAAAARHSHS